MAADKRLKFGKLLGRENPADLYTKYLDWEAIRRRSMMMTVKICKEVKMTLLMMLLMKIFRDSTSVSQSTGGLASNDSLDHLRSNTESVGGFR